MCYCAAANGLVEIKFDSTRGNLSGPDMVRFDRLIVLSLDLMSGGAWPFSVGGVICLVDSVDERDQLTCIYLTKVSVATILNIF